MLTDTAEPADIKELNSLATTQPPDTTQLPFTTASPVYGRRRRRYTTQQPFTTASPVYGRRRRYQFIRRRRRYTTQQPFTTASPVYGRRRRFHSRRRRSGFSSFSLSLYRRLKFLSWIIQAEISSQKFETQTEI